MRGFTASSGAVPWRPGGHLRRPRGSLRCACRLARSAPAGPPRGGARMSGKLANRRVRALQAQRFRGARRGRRCNSDERSNPSADLMSGFPRA